MLNIPLYHPVRIISAEPFGAKTPANSAVRMVSATANIYGSGVICSKRKRKNEVIVESSVRRFVCEAVERAPESEVGIRTNVNDCRRTSMETNEIFARYSAGEASALCLLRMKQSQ